MKPKYDRHILAESEDWGDICDNTYLRVSPALQIVVNIEKKDDEEDERSR